MMTKMAMAAIVQWITKPIAMASGKLQKEGGKGTTESSMRHN